MNRRVVEGDDAEVKDHLREGLQGDEIEGFSSEFLKQGDGEHNDECAEAAHGARDDCAEAINFVITGQLFHHAAEMLVEEKMCRYPLHGWEQLRTVLLWAICVSYLMD